jgi:hypothetical protein
VDDEGRDLVRSVVDNTSVRALRPMAITATQATMLHMMGRIIGVLKALPNTRVWSRLHRGPILSIKNTGHICPQCEEGELYALPRVRMVEVCGYCRTVYRGVVWVEEGRWGEYGELHEAWEMVNKGIKPEDTQGRVDRFRVLEVG